MRMILIRILLRLLSDTSYEAIKDEVIQEWLAGLAAEKSAFRGYYSIRKRAILGVLGIGVSQKEYWVSMGKLSELKQLRDLSTNALKKYDKKATTKES